MGISACLLAFLPVNICLKEPQSKAACGTCVVVRWGTQHVLGWGAPSLPRATCLCSVPETSRRPPAASLCHFRHGVRPRRLQSLYHLLSIRQEKGPFISGLEKQVYEGKKRGSRIPGVSHGGTGGGGQEAVTKWRKSLRILFKALRGQQSTCGFQLSPRGDRLSHLQRWSTASHPRN